MNNHFSLYLLRHVAVTRPVSQSRRPEADELEKVQSTPQSRQINNQHSNQKAERNFFFSKGSNEMKTARIATPTPKSRTHAPEAEPLLLGATWNRWCRGEDRVMALPTARSDSLPGRNGPLSANVLAMPLKLESLPKDSARSRSPLLPVEVAGDAGAGAGARPSLSPPRLPSRRGGRLVRPLPPPRRRGGLLPLLLPPPVTSSLVSPTSPCDRLLLCLGVIFVMWTGREGPKCGSLSSSPCSRTSGCQNGRRGGTRFVVGVIGLFFLGKRRKVPELVRLPATVVVCVHSTISVGASSLT